MAVTPKRNQIISRSAGGGANATAVGCKSRLGVRSRRDVFKEQDTAVRFTMMAAPTLKYCSRCFARKLEAEFVGLDGRVKNTCVACRVQSSTVQKAKRRAQQAEREAARRVLSRDGGVTIPRSNNPPHHIVHHTAHAPMAMASDVCGLLHTGKVPSVSEDEHLMPRMSLQGPTGSSVGNGASWGTLFLVADTGLGTDTEQGTYGGTMATHEMVQSVHHLYQD
ncbi:hypothetical protein LTR17_015155 [Elasticomyces elasticus]|nr:hypothetical protein LTR17_015155 [Elasticomyces elasticus]